jgi:LysM repeat protein
MKILKIFGLVAGIHAIALIMIFANPGCSSTSKPTPAPADTAPKPDPAPSISLPGAAPAADSGAITPAPVASSSDAPVIAAGLFSPTRPGTLAASALETQPAADVTPATTYTVGKGDSLWSIAKKNHVRVSVLAKANGIGTGSPLHLGQKLIIPGAPPSSAEESQAASTRAPASSAAPAPASTGSTRYVVKPGETLGSIARKFRVRLSDLGYANNISDPQKIHPGEELVIPARHGGAARAPRETTAAAAPAPAAPAVGAPPADSQDLDAGLKPAAAGAVPAIKIDEGPGQPADARQP